MRRSDHLYRQRTANLLFAVAALALCVAHPAQAQDASWSTQNREAATLDERGNYAQATVVAKRALDVAEKTYGPDHTNVAVSLNNLASLHRKQSQYVQAEALFKRSLTIIEKNFGPDGSVKLPRVLVKWVDEQPSRRPMEDEISGEAQFN